MPIEVVQRLGEIHEVAAQLHERLCILEEWASDEQGLSQLQPEAARSPEELVRRQEETFKAVRDLAASLDTWVGMSQSMLEGYLPQVVTMALNEA
jgi:hypothetical protein